MFSLFTDICMSLQYYTTKGVCYIAEAEETWQLAKRAALVYVTKNK